MRTPYPALLLLLCLSAALCPCSRADAALHPSFNSPAHLLNAGENTADIIADSTRVDSLVPRAALWRSALLPGWGQLYNGKPYKAAFFATISAGLLGIAIAEQLALDEAQTPFESEERAARRNTRILFFALSATFAALDAYVDAHLADFGASWSAEMRADGALLRLHLDLLP